MPKQLVSFFYCSFFILTVTGQNLIINPSFEDVNLCESKIPCSPKGWYSVSNMPYGFDNALEDNYDKKRSLAFLIYAKKKNIKTYWQTNLLCSLQKDEEYSVKFYMYSSNGHIDLSQLGFHFSNEMIFSKNDTLLELTESLNKQQIISTKEKKGWYKVSFTFKAKEESQFLLIGNLQNSAHPLPNMPAYVEYYIDYLSIMPAKKQTCFNAKQKAEELYTATKRHSHKYSSTPILTTSALQESKESLFVVDTFSINMQVFDFDSYVIKDSTSLTLVLKQINTSTIDSLYFIGYTDNMGSSAYNERLSLQRAEEIRNYFIERLNISESKTNVEGRGISTKYNDPSLNRRVEIIIRQKKSAALQ